MVLSDFYNHAHVMQAAADGKKIIENTPRYSGKQEFFKGDHVASTDKSYYKISAEDNAVITDVDKTCYGYYWYTVEFDYIPKGRRKPIHFKSDFKGEELRKI